MIAKIVRLDRLLRGKDGNTDDRYGQICGELVDQWTNQLAIPRLSYCGIQTTHLDKVLDETRNRNNPVHLERAEIHAILQTRL